MAIWRKRTPSEINSGRAKEVTSIMKKRRGEEASSTMLRFGRNSAAAWDWLSGMRAPRGDITLWNRESTLDARLIVRLPLGKA